MKLALPAEYGVIRKDCIYSLEAFADRLNVGEAWMRSARQAGLGVAYFGKRAFVPGDEFARLVCLLIRNARAGGPHDEP